MEYDLDDVPNYEGWDYNDLRDEARELYAENAERRGIMAGYQAHTSALRRDNFRLKEQNTALNREIERISLTGEVKADIESAYQRGYQAARRNLRVWATSAIVDLEKRLTDESQEAVDNNFGIARMMDDPESYL